MSKYPLEFIDYKHILTQEERNDMAMQLAEKHIEIDTLKDEKKSAASTFQAKIDSKTADINLYSLQIKDGFVTITVQAEKKKNFKKNVWEWYNPNTGELLKTKPFEGRDYQMSVDDQEEYDSENPDPFSQEGDDVQDVEHTEVRLLGQGEIQAENEPVEDDDPDGDPDDEQTNEPKKGRGRPRKDQPE